MEAIYLVCGARRPQLKRNTLGSNTMTKRAAISLLGLMACTSKAPNSNVASFSRTDAEMRAAIDSARATVGILLRRLANPPTSQSYVSVKMRFGDDSLGEHIWLDSVRFDGQRLHGQLTEDAEYLPDLRAGQWASVLPANISDWMIVDRGRLCGGFTIRVGRARVDSARRAALDANLASMGIVAMAPTDSC